MYLRGLVHIASVRQLLNQVILNNKLDRIIANDYFSSTEKNNTFSLYFICTLTTWVLMG